MDSNAIDQIVNKTKLENPNREVVHIPLVDEPNGEEYDFFCVIPSKNEILMFLKDTTSDITKQTFAADRLVLQCVKTPSVAEVKEILDKRPFYSVTLSNQLAKFCGIGASGEAKKY